MTVADTPNRWSYTGNGVTTVFAYTGRIFAATDLEVYLNGALQTLTTHYSVSGVNNPNGGNVTFLAAPAAGVTVVIVRDVPATQTADYQALDEFPAETHEAALDRQTILIQQAHDTANRSVRLDDGDATPEVILPLPAARAGKFLAFGGLPNASPMASPGPLAGVPVSVFGADLVDSPDAATARDTLRQQKIFNVKDYGAVNDNQTNDLAAFVAATTAARLAGGGTVYVPGSSSKYLINGAWRHDSPVGVSFLGDFHGQSVIRQTDATQHVLAITTAVGFYVKGLAFDGNNRATTTLGDVELHTCSEFEFVGNDVERTPYFSLGLNGCTYFKIEDNILERDAALGTSANYALNISSTMAQSRWGTVRNNIGLKSGMTANALDVVIDANTFDGAAYGAGISTHDNPATSGRYRITGNICINGVGKDVDFTYVAGMEINGDHAVIANNICFNNAGSGIVAFCSNAVLVGNECYNNGVQADIPVPAGGVNRRSGIVLAYSDASINARNAILVGNRCYDTAGAGGKQEYGYYEDSNLLTGIVLGDNNFQGNKLGEHFLQSNTPSITARSMEYTGTWDPANIAVGGKDSVTLTAAGAALGDYAVASFSLSLQELTISANVESANVTRIVLANNTAGAVNLGSGTVRARVTKRTVA